MRSGFGAAVAWSLTGGHGSKNVAAGDAVWNAWLCLYCLPGPTDECGGHGTIVIERGGCSQGQSLQDIVV